MTEPQITKRCPECTFGELVERPNRQDGSRFLGCSEYPKCRHSEPLPAYIELLKQGAPQLPGLEDA